MFFIDSMLTKVDKRKIPIWFIVGQNSDVTELNNMQDDVFNNLNNEFSEQYVNFNNKFQKFEIDELLQIEKFSPPYWFQVPLKLIKLIRFY